MFPEHHLIDMSTKLLAERNFRLPSKEEQEEIQKDLESQGYGFFDAKYIVDMMSTIIDHLKNEKLL